MKKISISLATADDTEALMEIYKSHRGGAADWNEYYPSTQTIEYDLSRDALYVMKDEAGEVLACISRDLDEEVEALEVWDKTLAPGVEFSRLAVRDDLRGQGIGSMLFRYVLDEAKKEGYKSSHILVKTGHVVALAAYQKLGYKKVGECRLFDKDFICMEVEL